MTSWRFPLSFALLFAFSPTLFDLLGHLQTHPWARASLVFPWLAWLAWRAEGRVGEPARWGWIAVGLALIVQLVAVAGDVVRLGRLGLALGVVGLCRGAGWSSSRVAVLLVLGIPVPHFVVSAASPALESAWAALSSMVAYFLGLPIVRDGQELVGPSGPLELLPLDGGLALVVMLGGLAWFGIVRASRRLGEMILHCCLIALVGFPLQLGAVTLATVALGLGADAVWLRQGLSWFPWLLIWGAAFILVWTKRHAGDREESMA